MEIRSFVPSQTAQVVELILSIQVGEFAIAITAEDQPDLQAIPSFYQTGRGNFWVAVNDERVIGTLALLDIGNRQAALRKMFVHPEFRGERLGVAAKLLATLLAHARERGVCDIYLGTTPKYFAAHRFYEKNGFEEIAQGALPPSFPVMAVDKKFYWLGVEPSTRP